MAYEHSIDTDRCKGCGICVDACPTAALMKREESPERKKKAPLIVTGS